MIDVALKYFLFDYCISIVFNGISENLRLNESDDGIVPKPGEHYRKISHKLAREIYYDCTIIEVEKIKDLEGHYTGAYIVYFNYVTKDTEVIEYDDDIDNEVKSYIRELSQDDVSDVITDDLTDDEIDALLDDEILGDELEDDDYDFTDVDLIATADPYLVGVNTDFFSFIR